LKPAGEKEKRETKADVAKIGPKWGIRKREELKRGEEDGQRQDQMATFC
jgi:hypothetical protein